MSDTPTKKRCPNCAWAIKRAETLQLSPGESWVLVVIAELVDGITLRRRLTQTELAARTRMTPRSVYQHVHALVKAKCLEIERTREGYHYHLLRRVDPPQPIDWPEMDEAVAHPDPQNFPIPSPVVTEPDQQIFPVPIPAVASEPENSSDPDRKILPFPILDSLKDSPKEERTLLRNGDAGEPPAVIAPGEDVRKVVWGEGKAIVRHLTGKLDGEARRQIGAFLRAAKGDCCAVMSVLRAASREGPFEPIPWIVAGIQARVSAAPTFRQAAPELAYRTGLLTPERREEFQATLTKDYSAFEREVAGHGN